MAEDWNAIAAEVALGLASVGFTVIHKRKSYAAGPNAWTPGAETVTSTPLTVVKSDYSLFEIDGTLIRAADERLLVPAELIVPQTGDLFTVSGVDLRVMSSRPLDPGGVSVMYEVQLRK